MRFLLLLLLLIPEATDKPRILFLTHSAGYVHGVVKRSGDELSHAEKQLTKAAKGRFEVVCTQDCGDITAENLAKFDAVVFYTTGELPIENKQALIDYVKNGGAFAGTHCATDTFYKFAPYGEMIGGYFDGHPWHQKVNVKVEDGNHASTSHLGKSFEITDEIYQFKNWDRSKVHVLLSLDNKSVDTEKRGVKRKDKDFAISWCKSFGEGRVFYTGLGHRKEVWEDERFLKHFLNGIGWAIGGDEVDDEGFTPIFDKDHTTGWKQAGPGGFKIKDGVATPHGGMGLWYYDKSYTNFTLKLEFQMEKISANSGVFVRFPRVEGDPWKPVREGYEIQIAGDKPSKNSTGSVYSFQAPTAIPLKKAGEWNLYEITCIGHNYYVRLNGTLINTYKGDRSLKGMIGMQNHDDRSVVNYRNVRVKELPDTAKAYHVLFEGDRKGWTMCGPGEFELKDGALTTKGGMGMLWHEKSFDDFILYLDWKVGRKKDNSGVFVRFPDPGNDPWVAVNKGYEIQICDVDPPKHRTGSVYSFKDSTSIPTKNVGEWNHYAIQVIGQDYKIWVNGKLVNEFKGDRSKKGHIGMQNHDRAAKVSFRNIRVVELKKKDW